MSFKFAIMAHRANLSGAHSVVENSLAACAEVLRLGFGLETDLRKDGAGNFYIGHDPAILSAENQLERYSELFRLHPNAEMAINVKELGYEEALIKLMNSGKLGKRAFFFDFELLETETPGLAQKKIKSLPDGSLVRLASRLSDRNESLKQCLSIPTEIVWGDEFDSLWITKGEVDQIHSTKRRLYMISPEIHGFDMSTTRKRWADFKEWGIEGLCTDFPLEAQNFFG